MTHAKHTATQHETKSTLKQILCFKVVFYVGLMIIKRITAGQKYKDLHFHFISTIFFLFISVQKEKKQTLSKDINH